MRALIADMGAQWLSSITAFEPSMRSAAFLRQSAEARLLSTIPGVGPLIASALVAAIGAGETFEHGRDLAAWLGLTPRQATTGGKPKLLGISKRDKLEVGDPLQRVWASRLASGWRCGGVRRQLRRAEGGHTFAGDDYRGLSNKGASFSYGAPPSPIGRRWRAHLIGVISRSLSTITRPSPSPSSRQSGGRGSGCPADPARLRGDAAPRRPDGR